jgi:hypothetical protein
MDCEQPLRCPSAQPDMPEAQVLGVVRSDTDAPRIAYLNEYVPATDEILAAAAPALPGQVLRLAARCETSKCTHFDGERCQLAVRIVDMLAPVTEHLPPCMIRKTCRWFAQEGRAACTRCPQVLTANTGDDDIVRQVAGVPTASPPA